MNILGISAFYHDSAATIIQNGEIIAAAQEERFTRKKHDPSFPKKAIEYCLLYSGLSLDQLDFIVFYDKPLLKFERLLETYYGFAPKGLRSFITSMTVWMREKVFLKKLIYDELKLIETFDKKKLKLLFPEHHLSHAASAFYPSPFEESAILTIDGVGEWATASIGYGFGNSIKTIKELQFPHSLGLLYSAFTYFLGFKVNSGEYKLMGLAPYGNPNSQQVKNYLKIIKTELIDIKEDGSIWLNQKYFNYATGLRMVYDDKWEKLFGFPRRESESEFEQKHSNLAFAIQKITEEVVLKMAKEAKRITNSKHLCLAGGVALNCVANGKLLDSNLFDEVFIQPASGDAGGSLGCALATNYIYLEQNRTAPKVIDHMHGSYLGPEYSDLDIELMTRKFNASYKKYSTVDLLSKDVAQIISEANVVGWHQGRMEFGPRALGNRSILGDPSNPEMQKKINLKIKYRESFRPFAPSVLVEDANDYFKLKNTSDYMLIVAEINPQRQKTVPENYWELAMKERLYTERSDVQSITHVDFSGRVQTVHKETNERYWKLLTEFKKITSHGLLINTSFNVRGEPIVCTPEDSYRCFMRTEMDYLVVGNFVFKKTDQPKWENKDNWKEEFVLD